MVSQEFTNSTPESRAAAIVEQYEQVLHTAAEIVTGDAHADPLTVFPAPHERRADDKGMIISTEQEQALRMAAAEFGFGRTENRTMSELGVSGGYALFEGGQAHKIKAETQVVIEDTEANPKGFIFAASPHRIIAGAEADITARVLDLADVSQVGKTEYDVAKQVAKTLPDYVSLEEPAVQPVSYDIANGFATSTETSGQLVLVGYSKSTPVLVLRIDRENYIDESGANKYRNQPGSADTLRIVSGALESIGDTQSPVAFVTSSTYEASRTVDAVRASLVTGRDTVVAAYGTKTLASVKGEAIPASAPINQLPGELHKAYLSTAELKQQLS